MTREEKAVRLAQEFVKDLAKVLFEHKDEFTVDVDSEEVKD